MVPAYRANVSETPARTGSTLIGRAVVRSGPNQEILVPDWIRWKRRVLSENGLAWPPNWKGEKAEAENDQARDIPAQVFCQPVIENPEPREHLAEQPAVQAVGNARRLAAAARPAAIVKAQ